MTTHRLLYAGILVLLLLTHMTGLLNDVFLSDSALYASIAKEMVLSGDWLSLTFDGKDWLDKPHLQFWITALSFRLFGINTFAYKLPAILFTFLALYYTYRLAREWYRKETALLAVLILASAQHLILSNNDVRAEPILTGLIITSVYYYHRLIREYRMVPLLLASLFAAAAMMCKGLFALIPIAGAVAAEILLKRQWSKLASTRWILSLMLMVVFISPELYALYQQFDLHPEKLIHGETGVSGIRFFLWDSQFGRFFNTGPIQGNGDPFFFLHTLIWAFLPWSILCYYMIYRKIRDNLPRLNPDQEFLTLGGAVLSILVFSLSGFQLPHYTNIIFPLLAIITAGFFERELRRSEVRFFRISQISIVLLMLLLPPLLQVLFRPDYGLILAILGISAGIAGIISVRFPIPDKTMRVFILTCMASILLNLYLNLSFYPAVLDYQAGSTAATYLNNNHPGTPVKILGALPFTMHFHAEAEVNDYPTVDQLLNQEGDYMLYTREPYLDSLALRQIDYRIVQPFEHYHITKLSGTFLNHRTRKKAIRQQYLLEILQ